MSKFKGAYDALVSQYETVEAIAGRIEEQFVANEIDAALALEPELNEAQAKAEQIGGLYQQMVSLNTDVAAFFVPAADPVPDADPLNQITRSEFERLDAVAKANFLAEGGTIQDDQE